VDIKAAAASFFIRQRFFVLSFFIGGSRPKLRPEGRKVAKLDRVAISMGRQLNYI
jgi:hypothetical protein